MIAFDIDSILAQTVPGFIQALNHQFNESYSLQDFHHYAFEECNFRPDIELFLSMLVNDPAFYIDLVPVEDALAVTNILSPEGIIYLSSRAKHLEEVTKFWLKEKGFPEGELILTRQKCALLAIHQCRFFIEDAPQYALVAAESNYPVYLLDYPWNQDVNHFFIKRIHSLKEIIE